MFHGSLTEVMGTRLDVVIIERNKSKVQKVWRQITSEIQRLDRMLNRFYTLSELSRINREASCKPICVTEDMWDILHSCKKYYIQTCGLFDITLKDFSKISFSEENRSISFLNPALSLDLGGYAKGYALEKVKKILLDSNLENCFIDFGNSALLGIGSHPYGNSWKVSVENPYNLGEILAEISLKNTALSVSGNTPIYSGHILRPNSRKYVQDHKLVCITTESPLDAEVLSTTFVIASANEKKQLMKRFQIKELLEYSL